MTNPVQELLDKNQIKYTHSSKDFLTRCFNIEHDDKNPSFRVDKVSGIGHCFSCGFKFNIFKYYGVITNNVNIKITKLKQKLKEVNEQLKGIEYPDGYIPLTTSFRGISANTIKKFKAFHTDKLEMLADRVCFPITDISDKVCVFVCRHSMSDANPRYINYPSNVSMPLYPSKLPSNDYDSIILVEGIFDMLNLYDKGVYNSICCFGTNNLNANNLKEKLLPFKTQGITKIYLLFDGDDAGRLGSEKLKPLLEDEGYQVINIPMDEGQDPGNLTQIDVNSLKEYTKNKSPTGV